jgi:Ca2+-binding EF-hand superfamily protein
MKTTTLTAVLALTGALAAAPGMASTERGHGRGAMLQELNFAEIDANGDGAITLEEWRSFVTARAETRRAEWTQARVAALMAGDTDGDGMLSAEELADRMQAMAAERREAMQEARTERRGRDGDRGWHRGRHGQHQAMGARGGRAMGMEPDERIVRSFQRIDRDGDGQITEAEFDRMVGAMQERMERRAGRMERRQDGRGRN